MNVITHDSLYERIREEFDGDANLACSEEQFNQIVEELCECEEMYLEQRPLNDDEICYSARAGLKWPDFQHLHCPIKKKILLYLVENPKTFFVLMNTQKGKTVIIVKHLTEWTLKNQRENTKIVIFVFLDNDRTLAEQTQEAFDKVPNSKIYQLSSNNRVNVAEIIMHIDAWSNDIYGDYQTPIIMGLTNDAQLKKIIEILRSIMHRVLERGARITCGFMFDECDKVYTPKVREALIPYIGCDRILHRLGFISATDGDMLDDYPECANAHFESHSEDSPDYRAFHHADSVVHIVSRAPKKHNQFAYKVLEENAAHFAESHRKIIVNGDSTRASMESFARKMTEQGRNYCITINMHGVKLFVNGHTKRSKKIKGCRLNAVLYWLYKREGLSDKPLYVIGNRKVDRGLGFHYAPRKNEEGQFDRQEIEFDGEQVVSENGEGLIFTDEILGKVERAETAVQKAGRLAGIIAQCPNYCGNIHFWTDEHTATHIRAHNRRVDHMNGLSGTYTAQQADVRAREELARITPTVAPVRDYTVSEQSFATADLARAWFRGLNLRRTIRRRDGTGNTEQVEYTGTSVYNLYRYNDQNELVRCTDAETHLATHIKYRASGEGDDGARAIMTLEEFNASTDVGRGLEVGRIMPVRVDGEIKYMVIYKNN